MVASRKIHCVICNKKCSGNVLRYQDHYYHRQCFEHEQSQGSLKRPDSVTDSEVPNPSRAETLSTKSSNQKLSADPGSLGQHQESSNSNKPSTPIKNLTNLDAASQTMDNRPSRRATNQSQNRSATLPSSSSTPDAKGFQQFATCAGCLQKISDGQALIALEQHWHIWCFKCSQCQAPLHGEYVAKEGRAYCEKDYQKLFGVACVYCKRYITGKVLQAGEAHHFHPSCARCSKCGDPFVPGEEMYLQGEVTWHPRCGPGPDEAVIDSSNQSHVSREECLGSSSACRASHLISSLNPKSTCMQLRARGQSPSMSSHSRSASPFSFASRQYGRMSPAYPESEPIGDLSRVYTISYLNSDSSQGYLRRPVEPKPPKSPQFSRPTSLIRGLDPDSRSRSSSRSYLIGRDRSVPRGLYSVLSGSGRSQTRARSPSMMNEEAIQLAAYPSGQKPDPHTVPPVERDDFPAPPFPYPKRSRSREPISPDDSSKSRASTQQRASRPKSREIVPKEPEADLDDDSSSTLDTHFCKEEEELSKIANGIGKIFLQTLKKREKLRAWKRANLDPRYASRTPSATRELSSRPLRYDNPTNASPSRDMDRPKPWDDDDISGDHSPTRTRSSLGRAAQMSPSTYGYKVVQSNRSTPRPGYGISGNAETPSEMSFVQQQRATQASSANLLRSPQQNGQSEFSKINTRPVGMSQAHLRRSMPNVNLHLEGPPKLYPYHLLVTSNYRLPPDVDRCHLERHLSNEEFQYIFHCYRLDFYRLPEWKRNELKRRAKLF